MYARRKSSSDSFCGIRNITVFSINLAKPTNSIAFVKLNIVWKRESPYEVATCASRNCCLSVSCAGVRTAFGSFSRGITSLFSSINDIS